MLDSNANVAALRKAYREWHDSKGKSVESWLALMAPSISFRSIGEGRPGGEFATERKSRDDIKGYFKTLTDTWAMIHFTVNEMVAEGDRVVMIGACAWTNRATGKKVETPIIGYWRFNNDKVVEYFEAYDTHRMVEAATA